MTDGKQIKLSLCEDGSVELGPDLFEASQIHFDGRLSKVRVYVHEGCIEVTPDYDSARAHLESGFEPALADHLSEAGVLEEVDVSNKEVTWGSYPSQDTVDGWSVVQDERTRLTTSTLQDASLADVGDHLLAEVSPYRVVLRSRASSDSWSDRRGFLSDGPSLTDALEEERQRDRRRGDSST